MLRMKTEHKLVLFIVPALAVYLFFFITPMLLGIYYSFTDWDGLSPYSNFIGLSNYFAIFRDQNTMRAVGNTLIYTIVVTSLSIVIGFIFALLVEKATRGNRIFRTLIFIPAIMSPVVASFIWRYMYSPHIGVINSVLRAVGLDFLANDWLGDPRLALMAVMVVPLWQWGGNVMIVFLAGLMNISPEYHEAGKMDGASKLQEIRHITLPLLRPALVFNVVISTIGSFRTFDFIFILTNGGPGFFTEVLTLRVYKYMLYTTRFGYGSAIAMLLTLLMITFALTELWLINRKANEY